MGVGLKLLQDQLNHTSTVTSSNHSSNAQSKPYWSVENRRVL